MSGASKPLALEGAEPLRTEPFPRWPFFDADELEAAAQVLRSGRVSYWTGEEGHAFEREYAEHVGVAHAVAVANGTVALEAALRAAAIGPGDEVVVTSRSFVASASCVAWCGGTPVFADVEPSGNLSAATIEAVLTPATRAVIVVHLAGLPCEMDPILALAERHGLCVIEDCAQAHGARYRGRAVGSLGHVAAFSFCQDKIITTAGEGGMVVTNDPTLWRRAWSYKDHGKDLDVMRAPPAAPGYRYLHHTVGGNGRLTEVQAAIGRVALRRLPAHHEARRANAAALCEQLASVGGFRVPEVPEHMEHAWYKLAFDVELERLREGWTRHRIQDALVAEGVPCWSGYGETYREPVFASVGRWQPWPVAKALAESGLVLRVDPALTAVELDHTREALRMVARAAFR
jgi:dTDP-4-amino-4,6-dideoxygalactose transaminase